MKIKNNLRINLFSTLILVIIMIVSIHIIMNICAYLTDADVATNKMRIGGNHIQITEDFEPPKEVIPGVSFKKNVQIKNLGPSDCYVRVKAVFSDSDMGKYCEVDWNTTDWIYNEMNGYYYYNHSIVKGESSTSLFTTITIKEDTPETAIKDFEIIIYAESYQSEGFDTYIEAWEYYNKNNPIKE